MEVWKRESERMGKELIPAKKPPTSGMIAMPYMVDGNKVWSYYGSSEVLQNCMCRVLES